MNRQTRKIKEVTEVFCSSRPITDERFFVGRENELYGLGRVLLTPCRHATVFGDRGVGKTSLVKMAVKPFCENENYKLIEYKCTRGDTPASLIHKLLSRTNNLITDSKSTKTYKHNLAAKAKFYLAEGGVDTSRGENIETTHLLKQQLNPDYVATSLQKAKVVYFLDEFDLVDDNNSISFLSELMKASSDYDSKLKLVLSGVTNSFGQLFASHASISRCLESFELPCMNDNELRMIIENGLEAVRLSFDDDLKDCIVWLSSGLPYFTHLLCEEITINAIFHERTTASKEDLFFVIKDVMKNITGAAAIEYTAMEEMKGTPKFLSFADSISVRPTPTPTEIKRYVIHSMALLYGRDTEAILNMYHRLFTLTGAWLPEDYAYESEGQLESVLREIFQQSKLLVQSDDEFKFGNPFYRAYSLLQCANEIGLSFLDLLDDIR